MLFRSAGRKKPVFCMLQLSVLLDLMCVYSNDIPKGNNVYLGVLRRSFDLSCQGSQNRENRDCARSQCTAVLPFWGLVLVCI